MLKVSWDSLALEGLAAGALDNLFWYAEGVSCAKRVILNLHKPAAFRTAPFFFNHYNHDSGFRRNNLHQNR